MIEIGPLRLETETFVKLLREHTDWEDLHLAPALRDADPWGGSSALRSSPATTANCFGT